VSAYIGRLGSSERRGEKAQSRAEHVVLTEPM